jgi:RNA polymerase-binding protein DksA
MDVRHRAALRHLLAERRAQLLREVAHTESDLDAIAANRGSEFEEHAQETRAAQLLARLDDRGKAELERVDAALSRIDASGYGICDECGGPIPVRRLAALPSTPYCRDCAERIERGERLHPTLEPHATVVPDYNLLTGRELEDVILEHLREDGRVDPEELRIVCRRGVAYLDGVVPSERERQIALHTVTDVMGLSEVVDRLQVRDLSWPSPAAASAGEGSDTVDQTDITVSPRSAAGPRLDRGAAAAVPAAQPSPQTDWNVLATAQEGAARDLKRFLKHHAAFRASGFRNVLLGYVADVDQFLAGLAADLEQKPFAQAWLGRILPIRLTFPVQLRTFSADVESRLRGLVAELAGQTFHVRVERRGHKGILSTRDLELRFGEFLWTTLSEEAANPRISFKDPDVVVAVEIVGETAGIAVIPAAWLRRFPFVKID